MQRRILLVCGVFAPLLYIALNIIAAAQWPEYSVANQTVSELSAIGAPIRNLWIVVGSVYTMLMLAFGWGVWQSAPRRSPLRIVGALAIALLSARATAAAHGRQEKLAA